VSWFTTIFEPNGVTRQAHRRKISEHPFCKRFKNGGKRSTESQLHFQVHLLQQAPRWLFRSLRLRYQLWQLWSLRKLLKPDFTEDDWKNGIQGQPISSCTPKSIHKEARLTLQMWSAYGRNSTTFNWMLKAGQDVQPRFVLCWKQRVLCWLDVWSLRPPPSTTRNVPSQREHFRCLPPTSRY
jgi:hypothetical protein